MCLIWYRPADKPDAELTENQMKFNLNRNPDGLGVMYTRRNGLRGKGTLVARTMLDGTFEEQMQFLKEHSDAAKESGSAFICHSRKTTKGKTDEANLHPHVITCKTDGDKRSVALMHNGTITGLGDTETSDSAEFAAEWLRPLLERDPLLYLNDGLELFIDKMLSTSNKLVIMDDTGKHKLFNKKQWSTLDNGLLVSNTYSLPPNNTGTTDRDSDAWQTPPVVPPRQNSYNSSGYPNGWDDYEWEEEEHWRRQANAAAADRSQDNVSNFSMEFTSVGGVTKLASYNQLAKRFISTDGAYVWEKDDKLWRTIENYVAPDNQSAIEIERLKKAHAAKVAQRKAPNYSSGSRVMRKLGRYNTTASMSVHGKTGYFIPYPANCGHLTPMNHPWLGKYLCNDGGVYDASTNTWIRVASLDLLNKLKGFILKHQNLKWKELKKNIREYATKTNPNKVLLGIKAKYVAKRGRYENGTGTQYYDGTMNAWLYCNEELRRQQLAKNITEEATVTESSKGRWTAEDRLIAVSDELADAVDMSFTNVNRIEEHLLHLDAEDMHILLTTKPDEMAQWLVAYIK